MQAEPISRVGVGLGEREVRYDAKGMRNILLVRQTSARMCGTVGKRLCLKLASK